MPSISSEAFLATAIIALRRSVVIVSLLVAGCSSGEAVPVPSGTTVGGPGQTEAVTVTGPGGASVTVPPGALPARTLIEIRQVEAPAPEGTTAVGPAFELTPHGTTFLAGAKVRIPIDPSRISPGDDLVVLKANPGEPFVAHAGVVRTGDAVELEVQSFSTVMGATMRGGGFVGGISFSVSPVGSATWKPGSSPGWWDMDPEPTRPVPLPLRVTLDGLPGLLAQCDLLMNYTWGGTLLDGSVARGAGLLRDTVPGPLSPGTRVYNLAAAIRPDAWEGQISVAFAPVLRCGTPGQPLLFIKPAGYGALRVHYAPATRRGFSREPEDLPVVAGAAPSFSARPVGPAEVWFGNAGGPPASYYDENSWERSDDGGHTWRTLSFFAPEPDDGDIFEDDAQLSWLRLPAVTSADDGALIRAKTCGTEWAPAPLGSAWHCEFSRSARLTVTSPVAPWFPVEPDDASVLEGDVASFTVFASGDPVPDLRWQEGVDGGGTTAWTDLPGETGQTLAIHTTRADDGRRFRVQASNLAGSATSREATLHVTPNFSASVQFEGGLPVPSSATVVDGSPFDLSMNVYDSGPDPARNVVLVLSNASGDMATAYALTPASPCVADLASQTIRCLIGDLGPSDARGAIRYGLTLTPALQLLPGATRDEQLYFQFSFTAGTNAITSAVSGPRTFSVRATSASVQFEGGLPVPSSAIVVDGSPFDLSMNVYNSGPDPARNVVLVLSNASGDLATAYALAPASPCVADLPSQTIRCPIGDLGPSDARGGTRYGLTLTPALQLLPGATRDEQLYFQFSFTAGTNAITSAVSGPRAFTVQSARAAALTIVSTIPTPNESWVPYDDPVTITFSEAIDPATVTEATFQLWDSDVLIAGTRTVSSDGTQAIFQPSGPLPTHRLDVVVTTGIWSRGNVRLAQGTTYSYSVDRVGLLSPTIAAAGIHTLLLARDPSTLVGPVYAWGTNTAGALGTGIPDGARSDTPALVTGLTSIAAVDGAAWYSLARDASGVVWGWGWGPNIGVDPLANLSPAPIAGLGPACAVSAGYRHALAVICNGPVYGWGFEDPLVIDPPIGSHGVRVIDGLTDIAAVAAGERFSLALRKDGVVFAWGNGSAGQLGTGDFASSGRPVRVPGLRGIQAIAAQSFTGVALTWDNRVLAWGANNVGQVGDGTTVDRPAPVQVLTAVSAIATGNYHVLALMQDGTVSAWGYNLFGRLGDGTEIDRWAPVPVSGLSQVAEVSGGEFHSAALLRDGSVWTWGQNSSGQLGIGGAATSLVPARVTLP